MKVFTRVFVVSIALSFICSVGLATPKSYSDAKVSLAYDTSYRMIPMTEQSLYTVMKGASSIVIMVMPDMGAPISKVMLKTVADGSASGMKQELKSNTGYQKVEISSATEVALSNASGYKVEAFASGVLIKMYFHSFFLKVGSRMVQARIQTGSKADLQELETVLKSFKLK